MTGDFFRFFSRIDRVVGRGPIGISNIEGEMAICPGGSAAGRSEKLLAATTRPRARAFMKFIVQRGLWVD